MSNFFLLGKKVSVSLKSDELKNIYIIKKRSIRFGTEHDIKNSKYFLRELDVGTNLFL